ncbi:LysR family transcriptional regulator [Lachnospiraceae bacterium ZAX-1]
MNSIQIEYFLALAKNLSFSDTARQIHVSQPAISKQISSLEQEIGASLFERGYRNLKLTKTGELFKDFLERTVDEYQLLCDEAKKNVADSNESIHIGFIAGFMIEPLSQAVKNFRNSFPEKKVQITQGQFQSLWQIFEEGSLDVMIALKSEVQNQPNITWRTIDVDSPLLVVSKDNPIADRQQLSIDRLKRETFLVLDHSCTPISELIVREFCQMNGFSPHKVLAFLNNDSIKLSVESNIGVALMHIAMLTPSFAEKVRWFQTGISSSVVAAWKRNTENRYAEIFVQELLRHVEHYED